MRLTKLSLTSSFACLLVCLSLHPSAATQFTSHVTINTPGSNVHHGVGNPIGTASRRYYRRPQLSFGNMRQPHKSGYPRVKPSIPFLNEDIAHGHSLAATPWQYNNYIAEDPIPVLPPSPYKVDSPDPESLWPEGLFLPPYSPTYFGPKIERISDNHIGQVLSDTPMDPYLLEGAEAIAAVRRANDHGELFFHDIPHINSLQANQQLRDANGLEKLRLGSLRSQWHNFYRH